MAVRVASTFTRNHLTHIHSGGFLLSAAEQFLKHELTKNFKVGYKLARRYDANLLSQVIRDLELMPQLLGQDWSSVFLQKFEGSVTQVFMPMHPTFAHPIN